MARTAVAPAIEAAQDGGSTTIAIAPHAAATRMQVSSLGGSPLVAKGDPKMGDASRADVCEWRVGDASQEPGSAVTVPPAGSTTCFSAERGPRRRSRRRMGPMGTKPRNRQSASVAPEAMTAGVTIPWGANSSVTTKVLLRCGETYQPFAYPSIS